MLPDSLCLEPTAFYSILFKCAAHATSNTHRLLPAIPYHAKRTPFTSRFALCAGKTHNRSRVISSWLFPPSTRTSLLSINDTCCHCRICFRMSLPRPTLWRIQLLECVLVGNAPPCWPLPTRERQAICIHSLFISSVQPSTMMLTRNANCLYRKTGEQPCCTGGTSVTLRLARHHPRISKLSRLSHSIFMRIT